jgi:hypothetical protein
MLKQVCFRFELFIVSGSSEVENHQLTSRLRSMLKQGEDSMLKQGKKKVDVKTGEKTRC